MKELDELDKQKALYTLMSKLNEAEVSIREEGTISADNLEAELGSIIVLKKGIAVSAMYNIECDYRYLYVIHNYIFIELNQKNNYC